MMSVRKQLRIRGGITLALIMHLAPRRDDHDEMTIDRRPLAFKEGKGFKITLTLTVTDANTLTPLKDESGGEPPLQAEPRGGGERAGPPGRGATAWREAPRLSFLDLLGAGGALGAATRLNSPAPPAGAGPGPGGGAAAARAPLAAAAAAKKSEKNDCASRKSEGLFSGKLARRQRARERGRERRQPRQATSQGAAPSAALKRRQRRAGKREQQLRL